MVLPLGLAVHLLLENYQHTGIFVEGQSLWNQQSQDPTNACLWQIIFFPQISVLSSIIQEMSGYLPHQVVLKIKYKCLLFSLHRTSNANKMIVQFSKRTHFQPALREFTVKLSLNLQCLPALHFMTVDISCTKLQGL